MYGRRPFDTGFSRGARNGVEAGGFGLHLFRHDWRYPTQLSHGFARAIVT